MDPLCHSQVIAYNHAGEAETKEPLGIHPDLDGGDGRGFRELLVAIADAR